MKIKSILVDGQGWIYAKDGEIEEINILGEMSFVLWYKQKLANGNERLFNGKYVVIMDFEKT